MQGGTGDAFAPAGSWLEYEVRAPSMMYRKRASGSFLQGQGVLCGVNVLMGTIIRLAMCRRKHPPGSRPQGPGGQSWHCGPGVQLAQSWVLLEFGGAYMDATCSQGIAGASTS